MEETLIGIDVGTTKICALVGEVEDPEEERLRIIGVGVAPSQGLRKGMVVNVEDAARAIGAAVDKAERVSGYDIDRAYVGVTGEHISALNSRGVVAITHGDHIVRQQDVERAIDAARAIAVPHDRKIVHAIPRYYILDGQEGLRISDPLGMQAFRLEVEVHIVTAAVTSLENLRRAVDRAGVQVRDLVLEPWASGEAVLTKAERESGVVLADIGGGTTDIAIFVEGNICHTFVLPVGGNHLTNDLAVLLRMPFQSAEELKVKHGHALSEAVGLDEVIEVQVFGNESRTAIPRHHVAQILEARAQEILGLIGQQVKKSGYDGLLPAGVVVCGGTGELTGIRELGCQVLELPVRIGVPHNLVGLVDVIHSPAYATSVGLLLWAMRHGEEEQEDLPSGPDWLPEWLMKWLKVFLPR
ncbi:MAG: cell division protein FtsA [Anaerolineae bacterium]